MNVWPPLSYGFVLLLPWKCQFINYVFVGPGRLYVQTFLTTVETVAVASTRQGQCSCLLWTNTCGFLSTGFRPDMALHVICSSYSRAVFCCIPPLTSPPVQRQCGLVPEYAVCMLRGAFASLEIPDTYDEGLDCGDCINKYQLIKQPSKQNSLLSTENQAKANSAIKHVSCWCTPRSVFYFLFCFQDTIKSCCSACSHCWGPTF